MDENVHAIKESDFIQLSFPWNIEKLWFHFAEESISDQYSKGCLMSTMSIYQEYIQVIQCLWVKLTEMVEMRVLIGSS